MVVPDFRTAVVLLSGIGGSRAGLWTGFFLGSWCRGGAGGVGFFQQRGADQRPMFSPDVGDEELSSDGVAGRADECAVFASLSFAAPGFDGYFPDVGLCLPGPLVHYLVDMGMVFVAFQAYLTLDTRPHPRSPRLCAPRSRPAPRSDSLIEGELPGLLESGQAREPTGFCRRQPAPAREYRRPACDTGRIKVRCLGCQGEPTTASQVPLIL